MSAEACCRFCGCTEKEPCPLLTNEACVLNVQTLRCSAPKCILAEQQRKNTLARQVKEDVARRVKPIAQQFIEDRRRRLDARNRRTKYRSAA